ncbi:winged helix-turn-helix domain-containing protein [Pelagerythrobacter sp.]|uniref:winged helix-turn-helix domain-containing protein n=1 Tax=Pelagerythrobacter sp. TaxID=2800702 RepID=UPI0035B43DE6
MWREGAADPPLLPRWMQAGPVRLDLFHRDGQAAGRWLGLHPREFEVFWWLAEHAPDPVPQARLLREVWRLEFDPETNRVAVAVCRIRAKLRAAGLRGLIATVPDRGYLLQPHEALDSAAALGDDAASRNMTGGSDAVSPERQGVDRSG